MLRIAAVEPTALFTRTGDQLLQQVRVSVENSAANKSAQIRFEPEGRESTVHSLGIVESGTNSCTIAVPDLRETAQVAFTLQAGDAVCDRRELT